MSNGDEGEGAYTDMSYDGGIIAVCVALVKPKPKVKVKVEWKHIKALVQALLNPQDYCAVLCVSFGVHERGEY